MRRREFLFTMAGAPAFLSARSTSRPPNIVVALCDDLGYGDLSCFGHPAIRTPRLDRFAAEGVRFTDCYASAPVCSPSRAGLVTGRIPYRAGIYDWIPPGSPMHLRKQETSFATLLKQAGYATCHSGKWHLNGGMDMPGQTTPGDHGFSHWFSTQNNAAPSHRNPGNFIRNGKPAGALEGYSADIIVREALQWLDGLDTGKPFCLFLCFHEPHEPVASAEELVRQYPQAETPEQAEYFANVTQVDRAFGNLLDGLDKRGRRDDTFIFFSSDNGPETRLLPALQGGTLKRARPLSWHYFNALGEPRAVLRDGDWKVVGIPARSNPRPAAGAFRLEFMEEVKSVSLDRFELYNLRSDPGEKIDLAGRERARLKSMSQALIGRHREVQAEGPDWRKV